MRWRRERKRHLTQLIQAPSTMDPSNPTNYRGAQPSPTEGNGHSDSERRRQLERLSREEAYYHFINDLSEEDYRLMRDGNLLGTPGEITAEELQQRLNGAKEQLTEQNGLGNHERGSENQGSDMPGETSNSDSLLEWLNTFRRTGNATRSGQSGNQTWRAVSRTNPNSGEFRFSLEININHEHEATGDRSLDSPILESNADTNVRNTELQSLGGPIANHTRSRTRAQLAAGLANSESHLRGPMRGGGAEATESSSTFAQRSIQSGIAEQQRTTRMSTGSQRARGQNSVQQRALGVVGEQRVSRRRTVSSSIRIIEEEEQRSRSEPVVLPRDTRTAVRDHTVPGHTERRRSSRNLRNSRSRSPLRRTSVTVNSLDSSLFQQQDQSDQRSSTRRQRVVEHPTVATQETPVTARDSPSTPSLATMDEGDVNHSSGPSVAVRRHPTIMLDLQVRRIRPGENRDRDSIANRTRSRVRMAENTVTFESDSGGFRRTISRSERAGIRTYVSTIRIPLRRISETGLGEPSSVALRSILRQIMTGFGELSSLMENDSDSELNQRVHQHPSGSSDSVSSQTSANVSLSSHLRNDSTTMLTGDQSAGDQMDESMQNPPQAGENRETRQSRDTNSLVENGTLPILRLAHFFLLNDDDEEEHQRGLTKEQIDNLLTRNYGNISAESEISKTCSVCINEYAVGNKLRRLPCAHEFHIHCIDRWLSENSTCPICRQPVLGSSN
uniref:RING-type E3 ubiquitin transferase n=2 Tax=Callorhinchus milii TaxID=7868 RepID=A0A4W3HRC3_CALMI|eukprot:gi/632965291/ref/XP_007898817.1/ PREDICTED: E3 ubiquitin-protein ligase RNF6 isoform X1 [Callorhinchus milii]